MLRPPQADHEGHAHGQPSESLTQVTSESEFAVLQQPAHPAALDPIPHSSCDLPPPRAHPTPQISCHPVSLPCATPAPCSAHFVTQQAAYTFQLAATSWVLDCVSAEITDIVTVTCILMLSLTLLLLFFLCYFHYYYYYVVIPAVEFGLFVCFFLL